MRTFHHRHHLHRRNLSSAPAAVGRLVMGWKARDPIDWALAELWGAPPGGRDPPHGYLNGGGPAAARFAATSRAMGGGGGGGGGAARPASASAAGAGNGEGGGGAGGEGGEGGDLDPLDVVLNLRPFMNHAPLTVRECVSEREREQSLSVLGPVFCPGGVIGGPERECEKRDSRSVPPPRLARVPCSFFSRAAATPPFFTPSLCSATGEGGVLGRARVPHVRRPRAAPPLRRRRPQLCHR